MAIPIALLWSRHALVPESAGVEPDLTPSWRFTFMLMLLIMLLIFP